MPWLFRELEVGRCSDITVEVTGAGADKKGSLVKLVTLDEMNEPAKVLRAVPTNDAGLSEFQGLEPGIYGLRLETSAGGQHIDQLAILNLEPESSGNHVFRVGAITVHGTVRWGDDEATGELRFSRRSSAERVRTTTAIKDEGSYGVVLPGPGRYWVELDPPDSTSGGPTELFDIPDLDDVALSLAFSRTRVSGVTVDPSGQPLEGVDVTATLETADGSTIQTVSTDSRGAFGFDSFGDGTLTLSAAKTGFRQDSASVPVDIRQGTSLDQTIVLRPIASAELTVVTSTGLAVAGAHVYCTWAVVGGPSAICGTTGPDGMTRVDIEKRLPLFCVIPNRDGAIGITLLTDDKPKRVTVSSESGTVIVLFVDEENRPVAGQQVLLRANGVFVGPEPLFEHVQLRGGTTVSGDNGIALLPGLPAGWIEVYRRAGESSEIEAATGGATDRAAEFRIEPSDTRNLTIILRKTP